MLGFAVSFLLMAALIPTGRIGAFSCYANIWLPPVFIVFAGIIVFQWYRLPVGYTLSVTQDVQFLIGNLESSSAEEDAQWALQLDSTIWIALIILRLRNASGYRKTLILFPDALGTESFRHLYVACRWKVTHADVESAHDEQGGNL